VRFVRAVLLFAVFLGAMVTARGAASRDELIFAINIALKTKNRVALEKCFNFQGVDEKQRGALAATMDEICSWPERKVFTSDRKDHGPMELVRDGRTYTLNGDWTFQIHVHKGKLPSKGFVFPAGQLRDGQVAILVTVPKSSMN
jgi:hypothetical protein